MSGKWTYRVLNEIRRLRRDLPRGWVTEVDSRAQHGQGYLSRILSGKIKRLDVETLFCLLEHPLVDAREFMNRIDLDLSAPNPHYYLDQIRGPRSKDHLLEILQQRAQAFLSGSMHETSSMSAALNELFAIDELRFSDHGAALSRFSHLLDRGAPWGSREWMVRALAVFTSLRRTQGRCGAAARSLKLAFELSADLPHCRANLFQRMTYLAANQGWWATASEFAQQAREAFVYLDNREGIGESLVDQAIMAVYLSRLDEAKKCYSSALKYLPERSSRNRTAALHGLGWIEMQRGHLAEAEEHLRAAMTFYKGEKGGNWAKIVWLQGEIFLQKRDFAGAEEAFRESIESFSLHDDPYDFALVALQLAEVLLLSGRAAEVDQIAQLMIRLLTPFQNNHLAGALILEFVQAAEQQRVTLKQLEKIRNQFRDLRGIPLEYPAQER